MNLARKYTVDVIEELIVSLEMEYQMPYEAFRSKMIAQHGYDKFRTMQYKAFYKLLRERWKEQDRVTYNFHYDAGHGWLEVPVSDLETVGVQDKITAFSYVRGDKAYLEEDCDFTTFFEAYKAKHGMPFKVNEVNDGNDSPIRRYARYAC